MFDFLLRSISLVIKSIFFVVVATAAAAAVAVLAYSSAFFVILRKRVLHEIIWQWLAGTERMRRSTASSYFFFFIVCRNPRHSVKAPVTSWRRRPRRAIRRRVILSGAQFFSTCLTMSWQKEDISQTTHRLSPYAEKDNIFRLLCYYFYICIFLKEEKKDLSKVEKIHNFNLDRYFHRRVRWRFVDWWVKKKAYRDQVNTDWQMVLMLSHFNGCMKAEN